MNFECLHVFLKPHVIYDISVGASVMLDSVDAYCERQYNSSLLY